MEGDEIYQPNNSMGSSQEENTTLGIEANEQILGDGAMEEDEKDDNKGSVKSKIWDHYQRLKVDGEWKAKCLHCGKEMKAASRNGTSSLISHIERYCKRAKLAASRQSTIQNTFEKHLVKKSSSFDQEISRKELANMIIMHEYPLSIVDHAGFRRFVCSLQPTFQCPTRNTIKNDIFGIYANEKTKLMKSLDKIEGRVAITSDMWTSNQMKGFMVVTAHLIDNAWKLQSRMLSFTYVPTPHTSGALCDTLMKTLVDSNIDRKVSTMTLDNCSTNDAMIEDLLGRLDESYLWLKGKLIHIRCCAHILNLIVQDGLEVVKREIETIRSSVAYWTATSKRAETFVSVCTRAGVPVKKKLILDCKTRWNSTYSMLSVARLYKEVFPRLKQIDSQYKCVPTSDEWKLAELLCDRLKVFYDVTLFSGTQYPTANLYFDKVCEIKLALNDWVSEAPLVVQNMTINMSLKFEKYWSNIHCIMGVAAVLDPRYKMDLLEFYYQELYGNDSRHEIEKVKQICCDLMSEYQEKSSLPSNTHETCLEQNSTHNAKLAAFSRFVESKKRGRSGFVRSELDIYLDEDTLPMSSDFDLLMWWKINGVKYPTLQKIARDIFAIPVSTVASESAFSGGGRTISIHRSKLKEETIEALMCTQNWLWASEIDDKPLTLDDYVTINDDMEGEEEPFSSLF